MYKSKEDVIEAVDKFSKLTNIPKEVIVIGGGGAMLLRGLRGTTADLNLWVNEKYFKELAVQQKVVNHPLVDTVVNVKDANAWVRQYNPYFEAEVLGGCVFSTYKVLPMLVFYRSSYQEHIRPVEKRLKDHECIVKLNDLISVVNKVKEVA